MKQVVYRGAEEHEPNSCTVPIFFSSSSVFAKTYGTVANYEITFSNPFDTGEENDIRCLLNKVLEIIDEYSESTFRSFEEIEESGLMYHDTWEMFEPYMDEIRRFGYDSMIIYEGGIKNYILFDSCQYKRV